MQRYCSAGSSTSFCTDHHNDHHHHHHHLHWYYIHLHWYYIYTLDAWLGTEIITPRDTINTKILFSWIINIILHWSSYWASSSSSSSSSLILHLYYWYYIVTTDAWCSRRMLHAYDAYERERGKERARERAEYWSFSLLVAYVNIEKSEPQRVPPFRGGGQK